jgi:hypothetical protein
LATALCLPARVREHPTLGHADELLANSALGAQAKIKIAGIGASPSKLGMGEAILSNAYNCVYKE